MRSKPNIESGGYQTPSYASLPITLVLEQPRLLQWLLLQQQKVSVTGYFEISSPYHTGKKASQKSARQKRTDIFTINEKYQSVSIRSALDLLFCGKTNWAMHIVQTFSSKCTLGSLVFLWSTAPDSEQLEPLIANCLRGALCTPVQVRTPERRILQNCREVLNRF